MYHYKQILRPNSDMRALTKRKKGGNEEKQSVRERERRKNERVTRINMRAHVHKDTNKQISHV